MPRQKLSEFRAKTMLSNVLGRPYTGWQIDAEKPLSEEFRQIDSSINNFVVKVDQAVKGRFKKGLVLIDVDFEGLAQAAQNLTSKGYRWLIVEPKLDHPESEERYLAIVSDRGKKQLKYSRNGGIDVEQNPDSIKTVNIDDENIDWNNISNDTGISSEDLHKLLQFFADNYFVFLEINPYLINDNGLQLLDAAIEVDDAGSFFVSSWKATDFRKYSDKKQTKEEETVQDLDENSPASFKLSVLEPNGSIFLLLSGGGASVVIADEIYNQGFGKQLGNYGEYSGNPNTEETYIYTKAVLELLLASSASSKVLFIGGAVANFTDIANTFAGVIQAVNEVADKLREQNVKVFVRRGGPNQEKGLAKIEEALKKHGLLGAVHGPDVPITQAVSEALQELPHE